MSARTALGGTGAALAMAALIYGGWATLDHERARERYRTHAGALLADEAGYDAEASDQAYSEALAAETRAEHAGWASGLLLLFAALAWPAPTGAVGPPRPRRAAVAAWLDVASLTLGVGAALGLASALGPEHAAGGALLRGTVLGATLGLWARSWGHGRPPGAFALALRYADANGAPPGLARGLAAALLSPLGLLLTPLSLWRRRAPFHLGATGLRAHDAR